jgi:hypothetical protein
VEKIQNKKMSQELYAGVHSLLLRFILGFWKLKMNKIERGEKEREGVGVFVCL